LDSESHMKFNRLICAGVGAIAALVMVVSWVVMTGHAIAGPDDLLLNQRNGTDTGNIQRIPGHPTTNWGVLSYDNSALLPSWLTLGSTMTINSGVLDANVPSPAQAQATRSLNSAFQISSSRQAMGVYSVQCTITASIAGGQNCDIIFEIASDAAFTTNVQTVSICGDGQTYTLAIALQGIQPSTKVCFGWVPAAYYTRLRTVQNTGTPSFSFRAGQEILF
jgi:hypothetical protein